MNKKNNNEMVLSTKDLSAVGINSQLSTNDLVEVVAHDIYEKYMDSLNDQIKKNMDLKSEYYKLMQPEILKMKTALKSHLTISSKINNVDEDDIEDMDIDGIAASFGKPDGYWGGVYLQSVKIIEKDKGTVVESSGSSLNVPDLKQKTAKILLTIKSPSTTVTNEIKVGTIQGHIQTTKDLMFKQIVTVSTSRFIEWSKKVKEYNTNLSIILSFLPRNGALSVERFTREARVKMNKKILSSQSPEFKQKMTELFNIQL